MVREISPADLKFNAAYKFCLQQIQNVIQNIPNNTPQAYPAVRCRDAQTGGFIFLGGSNALS